MENETVFEKIEGTVNNIVFQNDTTGYNVIELDVDGSLVTVVGEFGEVFEGEKLKLTGQFTSHQTYGMQFRAEFCERSLPTEANDIYKYLSSGVVKGVGAKTASAIVALFGDETMTVIEKQPERLKAVHGISLSKAESIGRDFKRIFGAKQVMQELSSLNVNAADSIKAYKKFGPNAADMIKENPYLLCSDDIGAEFETADAIAAALGYPLENENRIRAGILYVMKHNSKNGHTYLPYSKLVSITSAFLSVASDLFEPQIDYLTMSNLLIEDTVCRERALFLPIYYLSESYIANKIVSLLQEQTELMQDADELIENEQKILDIEYARLQKLAIKQALVQNILILTGGPGTGKTTALNGMISLFEKQGKRVLLCAPTGRAAQRMSEVTRREAKTVHRLLEVAYSDNDVPKFQRNEENPLKADVIIIDEISMVDVILFASLLKAMPAGCKIIMVGDIDQLPSVGAGRVLKDLSVDDIVPTVRLVEVFRQAAQSLIVTNAHLIVKGEMPELGSKDNDFFFIKRTGAKDASDTVIDLCSRRLPKAYGVNGMNDIQVLCPGRKNELGTAELNIKLQAALNPPSKTKQEIKFGGVVFRMGDKVMQIKNNYDLMWIKDTGENGLGIYNGDIGIIIGIDRRASFMLIRFDDRETEYPFDMLSELEHAYAVTVHKSQGSEYKIAVLPLFTYFDKLYYRNLLYTAVTRAKDMLIIVGDEMTVKKMIANNRKTERYTALSYMLKQGLEEYEQLGF